MEPIYVTGHRNPDTDSIVAAIAYASLRNALGDREYEPACLGRVSDETQMVLNHFGFAPPTLISNVYTQVQDLEFDKPPILSAAVTVGRAWKQLQERKEMHAIPVANDDGTLFGMMSREDIASYNMELNNACVLDKVPLFNVLSVLEGKVINEAGEYLDTVSGEVILAIPESRGPSLFSNSNCVVIKRVSIAKCHGVPTITASVIRLLPQKTEDAQVQRYYEFLKVFDKTGLYQINFSNPDSFAKFQSAMGFEPDYHWNEADRLEFLFNWPFIEQAYEEALGGYLKITPADIFLVLLEDCPFEKLREMPPMVLVQLMRKKWNKFYEIQKQQDTSGEAIPAKLTLL